MIQKKIYLASSGNGLSGVPYILPSITGNQHARAQSAFARLVCVFATVRICVKFNDVQLFVYVFVVGFFSRKCFASVHDLPSVLLVSSSIQSRGLYHRMKSSSFPFGLAALKLSISDSSEALIICVRSSVRMEKVKRKFSKWLKFVMKQLRRINFCFDF